jgi:hypothetical protein
MVRHNATSCAVAFAFIAILAGIPESAAAQSRIKMLRRTARIQSP